MGNYTSCLLQKPQTAKLVDSEGRIRRIQAPVKAAELMLEAPGLVICESKQLARTRRALAMKADEELIAGRVYLLFPAARLNCRVTDGEMSRIHDLKKKKKKRVGRVFPEGNDKRGGGEEEEDEVKASVRVCLGDGEGERDTGFPGQRFSNFRQWRPALETIEEGK